MVAKVFIERHVKPGSERRVLDLMKQLRINCLDQRGYVSGESLVDTDDPHRVLVISTWWNKGAWQSWHDSPKRQAIESQIEALLDQPEQVRVFMDGMPAESAGP